MLLLVLLLSLVFVVVAATAAAAAAVAAVMRVPVHRWATGNVDSHIRSLGNRIPQYRLQYAAGKATALSHQGTVAIAVPAAVPSAVPAVKPAPSVAFSIRCLPRLRSFRGAEVVEGWWPSRRLATGGSARPALAARRRLIRRLPTSEPAALLDA